MSEQDRARILIVDDEEAIRFFMADSLVDRGWQVDDTDSGESALVILADTAYDVILLDLRMPGIGGLAVMHEVKQQWPDTQIIIMTGYASIDSAIEAVRHGAFDYLRKPCSTREVIDSVEGALMAKRISDEQRRLAGLANISADGVPSVANSRRQICTGDLLIDLKARTVSRREQPVALTPTEYELLAMMAQPPGQVVLLGRLIEEGLGYDASDAQAQETLRVHVSRLRNKIGARYILTVRGGGYMLVEIPAADTPS
jgi:two-component system KDP operon response regulator KdpE